MGFRQIFLFFRLSRLTLKNNFTRPTAEKRLRWGLLLVLATLFIAGDYIFFHRIIRYLIELPFEIGEELIVQLLNVVFVTLFVMVLFSSLIVTLSVFYLSRDLEMVHSMPVSIWPVVFSRSLRTVLHSSWMVLIFLCRSMWPMAFTTMGRLFITFI